MIELIAMLFFVAVGYIFGFTHNAKITNDETGRLWDRGYDCGYRAAMNRVEAEDCPPMTEKLYGYEKFRDKIRSIYIGEEIEDAL